jgi:hypothetical protein
MEATMNLKRMITIITSAIFGGAFILGLMALVATLDSLFN